MKVSINHILLPKCKVKESLGTLMEECQSTETNWPGSVKSVLPAISLDSPVYIG